MQLVQRIALGADCREDVRQAKVTHGDGVKTPPNTAEYSPLEEQSEDLPKRASSRRKISQHTIQDSVVLHGRERPGLFPPKTFSFDLFFLRLLFHKMEESGYLSKEHNGVHVTMFRRSTRRFVLMFHPELKYDFEIFGADREADYIRWDDIRVATVNGQRTPKLELSLVERLFMVFDGNWNSLCGTAWSIIIFTAIIANVVALLLRTMKHDECYQLFHDSRCQHVSFAFTVVFSIDFFVRLICSPWVRFGILFPDWLIEQVVVDPKNANAPAPTKASKYECLSFFLSVPTNIVDFLSILPFYLGIVAGASHMHFAGFLRSLRLLRIFRVLKFGKFSRMLVVLGTTMLKSVQSISVLVLYMVMTSLIAGAMISQFELELGDKESDFSNVPRALWWVVARMVSMQHSLPDAMEMPISWVSSIVVICVGLFRGVIFVLPIGQISSTFKETAAWQQTQEEFREQIFRNLHLPVGYEWTQDAMSPVARIEVLRFAEDGQEDDIHTYGSLPLPLYLARKVDSEIWAAIHGHNLRKYLSGKSHSRVLFQVVWDPCEDTSAGEKLPHGFLRLRLIDAEGFGEQHLGCRIIIPARLHGVDKDIIWNTGPLAFSDMGAFVELVQKTFEIEWTNEERPDVETKYSAEDIAEQEEDFFHHRLLALLEEQSQHLSSLEVSARPPAKPPNPYASEPSESQP